MRRVDKFSLLLSFSIFLALLGGKDGETTPSDVPRVRLVATKSSLRRTVQ
jgi:hypothetical protein